MADQVQVTDARAAIPKTERSAGAERYDRNFQNNIDSPLTGAVAPSGGYGLTRIPSCSEVEPYEPPGLLSRLSKAINPFDAEKGWTARTIREFCNHDEKASRYYGNSMATCALTSVLFFASGQMEAAFAPLVPMAVSLMAGGLLILTPRRFEDSFLCRSVEKIGATPFAVCAAGLAAGELALKTAGKSVAWLFDGTGP